MTASAGMDDGYEDWRQFLSIGQSVEVFILAKDGDKLKKGKKDTPEGGKKGGTWMR